MVTTTITIVIRMMMMMMMMMLMRVLTMTCRSKRKQIKSLDQGSTNTVQPFMASGNKSFGSLTS